MSRARLALVSMALIAAPAMAAPDGGTVYQQNCAACHQAQGQGVTGAFPALAKDKIANGDPKTVAKQLMYGKNAMPAFKDVLNDDQMAAVTSYIRKSWGNKAVPIPAAVFAAARKGK